MKKMVVVLQSVSLWEALVNSYKGKHDLGKDYETEC